MKKDDINILIESVPTFTEYGVSVFDKKETGKYVLKSDFDRVVEEFTKQIEFEQWVGIENAKCTTCIKRVIVKGFASCKSMESDALCLGQLICGKIIPDFKIHEITHYKFID